MSTNELVTESPEDQQQQPLEDQIEELTEEEKQHQKEIQEKMKNVKIDETIFSEDGKHKTKKSKKEEAKKAKKSAKGQDFLDYANQNNIPINIQYEEDKYALEKKKAYDNKKEYKYQNYKSDNKPYKKQYHNNSNNEESNYKTQPQHKYQHKNQNYKRGPKRPKYAYGGNKFDAVNAQMVFSETQHIPTTPVPPPQGPLLQKQAVLSTDEEILKFVEQMFGSTNLNRDLYLRKHIENGEIKLIDVSNYTTLKRNNITEEKLIELLKNSEELELKGDENKIVYIKGYKDMTLLTVEEMLSNKKSKMQRMNNPMYPGPMEYMPYVGGYNNYIHMQNNYFIPPHFYSMPVYGQPVYYPQQGNRTQNTNEEA